MTNTTMPKPMLVALNQPLCGTYGRYNLYYFSQHGDAVRCQAQVGGAIIESSPKLWRVTVLIEGTQAQRGLPAISGRPMAQAILATGPL